MAVKGSSSTPLGVILTPNECKEYIHLIQVAKSASISFVAQIGNASAYIHLVDGFSISELPITFLVIRIFFLPLLLHHLYP